MSIRNLDFLFDPKSVAVIGATDRPASVGATVWRNLRGGGFAGPLWPVNPQRTQIDGEPCYAYVSALPAAPDLAVVCTPAAAVPGVIDELGRRGTKAAIVLTAGLDAATRQAMLDAARTHLLRILGPNCLGLLAPHAKLNASFSHVGADPGTIAFVSQSGALVTAVLDWARGRNIGFSHFVSLGEHADVDFGDMIDWLASDARTRAILLYVESIESPRKFMSAARAAARNKPVVVVKAGRTNAGQAAAASHTGALAGSDLVYDAAIRRAGMLRVDTVEDLFVAAETLAHVRGPLRPGNGGAIDALTIVTNGGGIGVMAADAAALAGMNLVPLSEATRAALDAALPANWSRANPVDIIGDAPVERYVRTFEILLADPAAGALLFLHAPTAIVPSPQIAQALVPVIPKSPRRVLSSWVGGPGLEEARRIFRAAGVPTYDTPEEAVRAFSFIVTYRRNQDLLSEAPPSRPPRADGANPAAGRDAVGAIIDRALAEGREMLTEPEAKALLAAAGVPVVDTRVVAPDPEAAVAAAEAIGLPVALKILSPDITHKSDVGGVALNLDDVGAVREAAAAILRRAKRHQPDARIEGFSVQQMVRRPRALELIVGASIDPVFGPVILFGQGGVAVEVVADRAIALPPLNVPLARALVERTRVAKLMKGYRDVPPVDEAAVLGTLTAVSQLLADEPRIAELDINPLLADAGGAIALDARVRVRADAPGGAARFAIAPYPSGLEECYDWNGRSVLLRPIRPEDEAQHRAFLEQLDPADIRMRVFYSRRSIERSELARLVQVDYEREMAFIATAAGADGQEETLGVVRAIADPDNRDAEFGILVRSDIKGARLGERLMRKMIDHLKARGTQRLVATVLRENERMLNLAKDLGFAYQADQEDSSVWSIALPLH